MKALAISICAECRHYTDDDGNGYAYCRAADCRYDEHDDDVPAWCPLPDMPEVE